MKNNFLLTVMTLGTLLAPMATYADDSDGNRSEAKVYVNDAAITTKIKAKLAKEHIANTLKINVDTINNGEVTLTGTTKTKLDAEKAVSIAQTTEGVKNVKNEIKVKTDD